jgi:topoisomerase IA-like protein
LWSQNSAVPQIYTDANGKRYCKIVLECNTSVKLPDSSNETDPPTADGGETNISAAKKPSAKKSSAKKSAAKKSAAKKSAAKKSTAKKSSRKKKAAKKRKAKK